MRTARALAGFAAINFVLVVIACGPKNDGTQPLAAGASANRASADHARCH